MPDSERGVPVRVEFLCDATGEEPARLRSLGAESILAMARPHMSITQTLFEAKEVKTQLLDGKGFAVERIHCQQVGIRCTQGHCVRPAWRQHGRGDLDHVFRYGSDLEEGARAFAVQFKQSPHRVALEISLDFGAASAPEATRRAIA